MSRSSRLLELLRLLRGYRHPVTAGSLAEKLGISKRSLYRDIVSLQAMGAPVRGEAGVGYVLEAGFVLPPLMFTFEEIEALALGADFVISNTDPGLRMAARDALARIAAVLPAPLREGLEHAPLMVGPPSAVPEDAVNPIVLRKAIRDEVVVLIDYRDGQGAVTQRLIWPFAMAYFEKAHILVAWCALREGFRHFRLDRLEGFMVTGRRFPQRRQTLLKKWHEERALEDGHALFL
ncbi:helix-turn-helix transcriptional regulator [Asaia lannensis]|uniref:YafY family transcriptional regulator n=1 Tax=Asaia lannensis NBRC 102526 TaxID=1307926 RepID=A0ABT1CEP8_9PROT|nr:YafY family protein [Asaia lannensis]MCO6158739.1 YafY family transcriptional regulator [Asaia lannensis NBRC 102526]GBR00343.1 transcriptional regulator [Asaia lannensis NBRC 102526]